MKISSFLIILFAVIVAVTWDSGITTDTQEATVNKVPYPENLRGESNLTTQMIAGIHHLEVRNNMVNGTIERRNLASNPINRVNRAAIAQMANYPIYEDNLECEQVSYTPPIIDVKLINAYKSECIDDDFGYFYDGVREGAVVNTYDASAGITKIVFLDRNLRPNIIKEWPAESTGTARFAQNGSNNYALIGEGGYDWNDQAIYKWDGSQYVKMYSFKDNGYNIDTQGNIFADGKYVFVQTDGRVFAFNPDTLELYDAKRLEYDNPATPHRYIGKSMFGIYFMSDTMVVRMTKDNEIQFLNPEALPGSTDSLGTKHPYSDLYWKSRYDWYQDSLIVPYALCFKSGDRNKEKAFQFKIQSPMHRPLPSNTMDMDLVNNLFLKGYRGKYILFRARETENGFNFYTGEPTPDEVGDLTDGFSSMYIARGFKLGAHFAIGISNYGYVTSISLDGKDYTANNPTSAELMCEESDDGTIDW